MLKFPPSDPMPRPKATAESVLVALMGQGVRHGTTSGGGTWSETVLLKPITAKRIFGQAQYPTVRDFLMQLVAAGHAEYRGRGRHAGWCLTAGGIAWAMGTPSPTGVAADFDGDAT